MSLISRNKYNNKKTEDGYDSSLEKEYKLYLIKNKRRIIEEQPKFLLQEKFEHFNEKIREINYIADYLLPNNIVIDIKGFKTHDFTLKEKIFKYKYKEHQLILLKKAPKYISTEHGVDFIEKKLLEQIVKIRKKYKEDWIINKPIIKINQIGLFAY